MLKERQQTVLDAVIREYIRTARPVASRDLRLGVSPATVRGEMQELDEAGFLIQPHTSAGRIPTDRGYRFFVDNLMDAAELGAHDALLIERLFALKVEEEFARELSRAAARLSGIFAAAGTEENSFFESGFSAVLAEPEFEDPETVRGFGRLVDGLEEVLENSFGARELDDIKICIGGENPLKDAEHFTITVAPWRHPRGFRGFLAMIGPTRTNYQKQFALVRKLKHGKR